MAGFLKDLYDKAYGKSAEVLQPVADAYNTAQDAITSGKRKFTDALVDATNLTPYDMRKGLNYEEGQRDIKDVTGDLFNAATPDATGVVPVGKFAKMIGGAKKVLGPAGKTLEQMSHEISLAKKATEKDMRVGSNLLDKPVLKTDYEKMSDLVKLEKKPTVIPTAADKAVEASKANKYGKLSTPDMGVNVSDADIKRVLNDSQSYKDLIANKQLKESNIGAYNNQKDFFVKKAREYLISQSKKK